MFEEQKESKLELNKYFKEQLPNGTPKEAQAFKTRKESDRHDSYYEGINQAVDIVKNCTIHSVINRREL